MNRQEDRIQKAIVEYLRWQYPNDLINHSPNEGNRGGKAGVIDGARKKAMGVCPGWPDIEQIGEGRHRFYEVKAPGGSLSESQAQVRDTLLSLGLRWALVRSVDDVKRFEKEWGR